MKCELCQKDCNNEKNPIFPIWIARGIHIELCWECITLAVREFLKR